MPEQHDLQQLATWHDDPTTVRAILDAIAGIWQGAAKLARTADGGAGAAIIRTSVLNLVVYAASRGVAERAAAALQQLSGTHPSRSILLVVESHDPSPTLAASVRAHRYVGGDGKYQLSFEQIDLDVRDGLSEHLANIVNSLLIHDLPTFLWWPGDPPITSAVFSALAAICERIIVDSSDFSDPVGELRELAAFAAAPVARETVSDLNWNRLIDWREMLAQFFDGESLRARLEQIRSVRIEYEFDPGGQQNSAQALLIAAWLASRLGWQLDHVSRNGSMLALHTDAGQIRVEIEAVRRGHAAPGSLNAIRIDAGTAGDVVHLTLAVDASRECGTATVEQPGSNPVARTVQLVPQAEAGLLSEEMEAFQRERAYDDALRMVGAILRLAESVEEHP